MNPTQIHWHRHRVVIQRSLACYFWAAASCWPPRFKLSLCDTLEQRMRAVHLFRFLLPWYSECANTSRASRPSWMWRRAQIKSPPVFSCFPANKSLFPHTQCPYRPTWNTRDPCNVNSEHGRDTINPDYIYLSIYVIWSACHLWEEPNTNHTLHRQLYTTISLMASSPTFCTN